MRGRVLLAAALLIVVPASALAQDGSQPAPSGLSTDTVTFYGHVFGHGLNDGEGVNGPMPANTHAPIGENLYGLGTGVSCEDVVPGEEGVPFVTGDLEDCDEEGGNKMVLFSTAGPVDVQTRAQFEQEGGYGQLHNERGQTKDVLLDPSGAITASISFTMDAHGWPVGFLNGEGTNCLYPHPPNMPCLWPYWGWDPGAFENVVVDTTLYSADLGERSNASAPPPIQEALENDEATVVAQGEWGPDTVMNGLPGAPSAMRFDVDLGAPEQPTIPKDEDFFIVYNVYQRFGGNEVLIDAPMRWWSGEFFPPTFELPVKNAFTVERVVPEFAHGKLAILGILNTPWGSYDVDAESVEIEIDGPAGQTVPESDLSRFADFSVAHGGHFKPVNITWIWDYLSGNAKAGDYTITVSASNAQHSASAECTASFTLQEGAQGLVEAGESAPSQCGTQSVTEEEVGQLANATGTQG